MVEKLLRFTLSCFVTKKLKHTHATRYLSSNSSSLPEGTLMKYKEKYYYEWKNNVKTLRKSLVKELWLKKSVPLLWSIETRV